MLITILFVLGAASLVGRVWFSFKSKELLKASHADAGAYIVGILGHDLKPGELLHERVHLYTGMPWLLLLHDSFTIPVLMLCGIGFFPAFGWSILIGIMFRWGCEFLADTIAFAVYKGEYVRLVREAVEKKWFEESFSPRKQAMLLVNTLLGYPPYRFALFFPKTNIERRMGNE